MNFAEEYLNEVSLISKGIDCKNIENVVSLIFNTKENHGRLFVLGVGGSASTASHAVNDFRKICNIEAYSPVDNVAELTAITNDEGWEYSFERWLQESKLNENDTILIFSVGGGNYEKNISRNLIKAVKLGISRLATIIGVIGKDGGYVRKWANATILIPELKGGERTTPHTEEFGSIILHLLVSHPTLKQNKTKWESENE